MSSLSGETRVRRVPSCSAGLAPCRSITTAGTCPSRRIIVPTGEANDFAHQFRESLVVPFFRRSMCRGGWQANARVPNRSEFRPPPGLGVRAADERMTRLSKSGASVPSHWPRRRKARPQAHRHASRATRREVSKQDDERAGVDLCEHHELAPSPLADLCREAQDPIGLLLLRSTMTSDHVVYRRDKAGVDLCEHHELALSPLADLCREAQDPIGLLLLRSTMTSDHVEPSATTNECRSGRTKRRYGARAHEEHRVADADAW